MTARLFYIDDSGSETSKLTVFGWVELLLPSWNDVLRGWLDWRHQLYHSIGIPADYELHATKFVNGRGRPTGTSWDRMKSYRTQTMTDALLTITSLPGLSTGAVFRHTPRGTKYHQSKAEAYAELVRRLDARLTASGEFGLIVLDGDGSDPTYRLAHRDLKLATRSLLEDPLFQGAHHSQWIQMADLIAYSAYMHLARIPAKQHTWEWHSEIVAITAITGDEPLDLKVPE